MADCTEDALSSREQCLNHLFDMLRQNEAFLYENARELYTEIVALVNDATEHIGGWNKSEAGPEDYVKAAMPHFLIHVLFPVSGAIHLNALAGNLPGCYSALRLALESLVKCYLADRHYPGQGFFRDRLRLLENSSDGKGRSTTSFMKECDKLLEWKDGAAVLWKELSEVWVHASGVMKEIVDQIVQRSEAPAWGIVLPQTYAMGDTSALNELKRKLAKFRALLRDAISHMDPAG